MKLRTQGQGIWAAGIIAMAVFAGNATGADPLAETAAAKAAAAKAVTQKVAAADAAAREAISARAAAALAVSAVASKLSVANKTLAAADAAAKAGAETAVANAEAALAAARKAEADMDAAAKAAAEKFTALRRDSYPVVAEKAAAEKALAERTAARKVADAKVAAEKAAVAAAALEKAEAGKAAAERSCEDCVAQAASARKDPTGRTGDALAAAGKTAADAAAKADAAKKALADRGASLKAAAQAAQAAKSVADKAAAEKTAAEKELSAKIAADKTATETVRASDLYVALKAVDRAAKERADAVKVLSTKARLESKTRSDHASAKSAADKASAEARAARDAVAEKAKALVAAQDKEAVARAAALGGLKPMPSGDWTYAKARHLMVRAAFGGTPAEVQKLYEMGLHDAVNHFVEIYDRPVAHIEFDPARLRRPEPWEARLDSVERQDMTVRYRDPERRQQAEMRRWWLERMAESPRPLQEKLTLFWHDHFAVQYQKRNRTYMLFQQNQLFRTYGADNFGALLRGIVHDPAMIAYLDNNVNYKGSGNENLGREILELFSMGEGRGYTEEDLREASRALTGYTYDSWTEQFRFLATRHDEGPKKILGATGNWGGDDLVDIILSQPATAGYVTEKLFEFLAYEDPEDETIEKLAHVMRACSYDLRPMLKNLFLSEEFYSEKAMGTHIKGPVELTIGAIRDLGIQEGVNYATVDAAVNQMGQYLFEPPNVAGWNEKRTWINAERILVRYNQLAGLVEQPNVDIVALLEGEDVDTPAKVVEQLAKTCLVVTPDAEKSKALADYLGELPPVAEWNAKRDQINAKLREILVLLMSTPESQLG